MVENADSPADGPTRAPEVLQAEREIERTRVRVSQSVMALREAVARRADWREWVRERPTLFVVGAFALGLLWGLRAARRAGPSSR